MDDFLGVSVIKSKTCCFTGHREIPSYLYDKITKETEQAIEEHIRDGYLYFGTGGALGFDTIAALTVLKLRKKYPYIKLILVLPCSTQTKNWLPQDVKIYEEIKKQANKVVYTSQEYAKGCMHKRNRHLVDHSSACICYFSNNKGGTAYTVNYALNKGLTIHNVAAK